MTQTLYAHMNIIIKRKKKETDDPTRAGMDWMLVFVYHQITCQSPDPPPHVAMLGNRACKEEAQKKGLWRAQQEVSHLPTRKGLHQKLTLLQLDHGHLASRMVTKWIFKPHSLRDSVWQPEKTKTNLFGPRQISSKKKKKALNFLNLSS
jgi:hypothetical protein